MVRNKLNTAHKNRLTAQSNGSLHLYALSKGENWMKLVSSMIKKGKNGSSPIPNYLVKFLSLSVF